MARLPDMPLYLFYGTKTDEILQARDEIVRRVLPPENRDSLIERFPAIGYKGPLADHMDEIAGDFSTLSFIAEERRCAVVTNPSEAFSGAEWKKAAKGEAQGKKADKLERAQAFMMDWLAKELPKTKNVLILLAYEDEAEDRVVDEKKPNALYKLVQQVGYTQGFREKSKAAFRIPDALAARDVNLLLASVRELWKGGKGDQKVYGALLTALRWMLQADIAAKRGIERDAAAQANFFPSTAGYNLFKAHEFVQKKYLGRAPYRTDALLRAHAGLLDVYRAMRPRQSDLYVPDSLGLLEHVLIELVQSPRPSAR